MKTSPVNFTIFILLFIFSFILRLSLLRNGPFDLDSLNLTIQSLNTIDSLKLQSLFGPGYPLVLLLSVVFILLSKAIPNIDPFTAVNVMSAFFGSLSICLFYKLIFELFHSSRCALLGAVVLSVCPIFLDISLYGMGHTPTLFFLLLGILNLNDFHKKAPHKSSSHLLCCVGKSFLAVRKVYTFLHCQSGNRKYLWFSSLCFGCMGSARFQDLILMIIPISYLFFFGLTRDSSTVKKTPSSFQFIRFWTVIFFIIILFHLPFILTAGYKNQLLSFITMGTTDNFRGFLSPSLLRSLRYFINNFTWSGMFAILFGLTLLIKENRKVGLFCLLWIFFPLSFYGNLFSTAPRFFVTILPALIIPQIYFLNRLMNIQKIFLWITLFIAGIMIFIPFYSAYPKMKKLHDHAYIPEFSRWISDHTETDAVIIPADEWQFIEYFGHRKILFRPTHHAHIPPDQIDQFKNQLDILLIQKIPVYITFSGLNSYNPEKKFSSMIKENYNLDYIGGVYYQSWHRSPYGGTIDINNGLFRITKKD